MADHVKLEERLRIVGAGFVYRIPEGLPPEYLVIKRPGKDGIYPGKWTVPSGGLDIEDYMGLPQVNDGWENMGEAATRREIREESGVEVGDLAYMSTFVFIRPNDKIPVFGVRYSAPYLSGEVRLNPDIATNAAWILASQAGEYDFLGNIPFHIAWLDRRLTER